ncbi:MAG: peptidase S9, partial [Gemmatimonadetes bacterium]|nr:peptidase S9 [Gemmatimonadota bacterium]
FDAGEYNGYALEASEVVGSPVQMAVPTAVAGRLPVQMAGPATVARLLPPTRPTGVSFVSHYLADAETGLPPADAFGRAEYEPALQLDYVGQPTFGVGVDRFGTGVAGATAVFFSDMLGNRNLALGLQANGRIQDIGGQAVYMNLRSRWNWGVSGGRIPYLLAYTSVGAVGFNTIEVNQLLQRIYIDQAVGLVSYPLSSTRRIEANGGLTRYSYGGEIETFLMAGNQVVDHRREDLPKCTGDQVATPYFSGCVPDALNLFQAAVAYVGDYSFFAFTSPVRGGRFRFEIQETLGTLNYRTVLADYRRYFFGRPVTLAARGLHYGRFGADANTGRLNPLFLGYETFVRGYAAESFQAAECSDAGSAGACPAWNRLFGSRIGVFNMEVRLPLFGVPEFGLINFPYLPTEIGAFVDGGAAWQSAGAAQDELQWRFDRETDQRVPVFSTGVNARFNVLGFLVFEAYYAYPFQRPERGWHWGFQLAPGW